MIFLAWYPKGPSLKNFILCMLAKQQSVRHHQERQRQQEEAIARAREHYVCSSPMTFILVHTRFLMPSPPQCAAMHRK